MQRGLGQGFQAPEMKRRVCAIVSEGDFEGFAFCGDSTSAFPYERYQKVY